MAGNICQKNGDVEESRLPPFHEVFLFPEIAFWRPFIVLLACLRVKDARVGFRRVFLIEWLLD